MTNRKQFAVIGAGITGLAAAWRLVSKHSDAQVTIFEASDRVGGIIHTIQRDGFLIEKGPDSFITNKPGAVELCREIGFTELIPTDETWRRSLVLRKGKPVPVPDGFMLMAPAKPMAIISTPILSPVGKLRLLSEAFIQARKSTDDESLADFVRRRFGHQTLDRLVQPLVGGIYTSDPEKLSIQATLPRFPEMEKKYGSVIRGTLASQKRTATHPGSEGSGARYGLFLTAKHGLSSMTEAIARACQQTGRVQIRCNETINTVSPSQLNLQSTAKHAASTSWLLQRKNQTDEVFDAVIITLPTQAASRLLAWNQASELREALDSIPYASSAVVVTGHRLSDFNHPLDAFGLVIPDKEGRKILAVSFTSRKFPARAPEGCVLLRTFVGGAMQPELMDLNDDQIMETVRSELAAILGMKHEPVFEQVTRYARAMPQYHVGHAQRVECIESCLSRFPGLKLAGSAYHGVGIPDSIVSGNRAADQLLTERD